MDSFKVIFLFVITNILESYARLSLEEKLNLLTRLRPSENDVRNSLTENNDYTNHIIRENPKVYILQTRKQSNNDVRNSLRENSDYTNRRSHRNRYVDTLDLDPKKYYRVNPRRMYDFHPGMRPPIIASPTMPSQLPEAEAILPGHTLIRPALGMLKSAVKFPHREPTGERGAGVYGNLANLGMTYGGSSDQVLYTGFRRNNNIFNDLNDEPTVLIALLPEREAKPILRYIDYGKRERERKARQAEEKMLQEKQKLRQEQGDLGLVPKNYYNSYSNENKVKEVKRLLKSLNVNGVTLEFFYIPRLKLQAMERENNHDSVKPYTESVPRQNRWYTGIPVGVKKYA